MDRFAAADLLREVTTERFGSGDAAVAAGLALRYDGGSCFRSEHYRVEIDHLGIARSPAYHHEPETNGGAEKFIQTLREQILWTERFDTFEEAEDGGSPLRPHLQPRVATRAPRLPHTRRDPRAPARPGLGSPVLRTLRRGYRPASAGRYFAISGFDRVLNERPGR